MSQDDFWYLKELEGIDIERSEQDRYRFRLWPRGGKTVMIDEDEPQKGPFLIADTANPEEISEEQIHQALEERDGESLKLINFGRPDYSSENQRYDSYRKSDDAIVIYDENNPLAWIDSEIHVDPIDKA